MLAIDVVFMRAVVSGAVGLLEIEVVFSRLDEEVLGLLDVDVVFR